MYIGYLESPGVFVLVDLDRQLASAVGPNAGAVRGYEICVRGFVEVGAPRRQYADFGPGIDQEVNARGDISNVKQCSCAGP